MTKHIMTMAALSAALLLGTAGVTATAIEVGVSVGNGNTGGSVTIGSGAGPLATVDSTGNAGGSQTDATVNLGSLLAGLNLGGGAGPGGPGVGGAGGGGGGGLQAIVASLSAGDRELLALRCRNVLEDPIIYKVDVVDFCRMVAKLNM